MHRSFILIIVFFFFLKGVLLYILPIRVVLQPSFKCGWTCVCVWWPLKCRFLIFSMLFCSTRTLFTVMTWRCLFVFFFFFLISDFVFLRCLCIWVLSVEFWLVGFVLYGCCPCLDLMLPKSYTNWTIKDILNSENTTSAQMFCFSSQRDSWSVLKFQIFTVYFIQQQVLMSYQIKSFSYSSDIFHMSIYEVPSR